MPKDKPTLSTLEHLNRFIENSQHEIKEFMKEEHVRIEAKMDMIHKEVRRTNGRVKELEIKNAAREAVERHQSKQSSTWLAPIITGLIVGSLLLASKLYFGT